jgi:aquaporin Z
MQARMMPAATTGGRVHPELSNRERAYVHAFNDPRLEWVRLFAEFIGTFLLVLVAAGGGVVDAMSHGAIGRAAAVTAPGLAVLVLILATGAISGAHLNPVVTIAFAFRTDFQWWRVPGYLLAQFAGAIGASATLLAIFGRHGDAGLTLPSRGFTDLQATAIEALLTFGLVTIILGAASGAQNIGALSAFAAAGYVVLAGLWASPVSGASMNPARSIGPALIAGDFAQLWIYAVGPLIGALLAVAIAFALRGRGGDPISQRAAQGTGGSAAGGSSATPPDDAR